MKTSRSKRQQVVDAVYCLLSKQLSPQETLLWWACPSPSSNPARRVRCFVPVRTTGHPPLTRDPMLRLSLLVASVLAILAGLGLGSQAGISTEQQLAAAVGCFLAVLFVALVLYALRSVHRRWDASTRWRRQVYGLTDQRVLLVEGGTHHANISRFDASQRSKV